MIKQQKRSYSHVDNEVGNSNVSDEENIIKRQRNESRSSTRSYMDEDGKSIVATSTEMRIPYCLLLPNRAIGYVIGKSGNNVREIEKACGAVIKCQKEFDISVYPPPSEKILTIFGKKENKKKALELVLGKSKSVMDFQEEDGKESIVIIVPTRSIPIIIGQKGSKISSLSERSSCEINVHKDDVPGIKDKAIFIKSKKISKIIDCIGIIYDLLEDVVENGILTISEFPGVPKNDINNNNDDLIDNDNINDNDENNNFDDHISDYNINNNIITNNMNNNMMHINNNNNMNNNNNNNNNNRMHHNNSINYRNINNHNNNNNNPHYQHNYNNSNMNNQNNNSKYMNMKKNDNYMDDNMSIDDNDNYSVPKEKNLLLHKYGKEVSPCVVRFVLDVETTAWIIGKAGCHIKEIRSVTGAGAVIVDAPDNIENVKTCDRILTLSGSAENKFNALKLIVRQMEEREKNINNPMRMLVPGKAASFLIGRKGSIIKYITEQSGSQIQVAKNKESENEKLVLITGSPEAKILASVLVLQKLEEYENPAIAREGLVIPLNDIYYNKNNNNKYSNHMKKSVNHKIMHNNKNSIHNNNNTNSDDHFMPSNSLPNHHFQNNDNHMNSNNYTYDNHIPNKINTHHNNNSNDMKTPVENMFLEQIYKSFPYASLPKIISVKQPYTIELNMPDLYLETFDSQNKNGKSLIDEIVEKSGCNISICTDSNDSSSYTFNVSITGSPLANSLAILMIQSKIFKFDWF
ncbi:RNA-binding protein, putative [Plasmodium sp. gorilla clade G2]|uniref:RNA-binding protein, putative n=1 Tax=Plasmodium sp. gorilla clade G2 TaxID=880535 RepID=UPI000D20B779|nr:RNA-binding protein, putative [Plasmodium sp. gorilla clade G2]SOV12358.1 RNA-binding protein, putative [Plasmodium sp. gorilla clade G2]